MMTRRETLASDISGRPVGPTRLIAEGRGLGGRQALAWLGGYVAAGSYGVMTRGVEA